MSGLNNTRPHYGLVHSLTMDQWARLEAGSSLEVTIFEPGSSGPGENIVLELDSAKQVDYRPSNLAIHGCMTMVVSENDVVLRCAGYIAYGNVGACGYGGTGVLWVEDGVTPLDDPSM